MAIRVQVPGHGIVEFPDGTSQAEMAQALASLSTSPAAPATSPKPPRSTLGTIGDYVGNALPTIGGVVGGLAGGIPGAAVGGAAGEGFRQFAQHATEIPGAVVDVARNLVAQPKATLSGFVQGATHGALDAGEQAVGQGVGQAVGAGVVKGAGVMSKWLMNRATTRVSAKLMQDFPELSDTLIDNALTVSKGGYGRARALLMTAKGKATTALRTAEAAGKTVPVELSDDLAQSLKTALLEDAVKARRIAPAVGGAPLTPATARLDPTTSAVFAKIDATLAPNATSKVLDLTPSQADLLKTQLQRESRALYANRTAPNGPKAMGMDATERGEFAAQINSAIDALATGYKAANAEAKPLIGAVRGIQQAIRPNGNLYQAMVRPAIGAVLGEETSRHTGMNPYVGGMIGAAATSPAAMSREAIILAHPAMRGALRALPKPLAQYLLDVLSRETAASAPTGPGTP